MCLLFSGATRQLAALAAGIIAVALAVPGTPAIASVATLEAIAADDACPVGARPEDSSCTFSALQSAALPSRRSALTPRRSWAGASNSTKRRPLKVIAAGLSKTGTSSLKVALDRLGYFTVHGEFLDLNSLSEMWYTWERDNDPWPVINGMLDMGYNAVVDRPWNWVYKELLGLYPDAKVILQHYPRGDPQERGSTAWVETFADWTIPQRMSDAPLSVKLYNSTPGYSFSNHMFEKMFDCPFGAALAPDPGPFPPGMKKRCKAGYERWYDEVKRFVPPAQLLEYNVTEGWGPICKFLEVEDCPTEPFPDVEPFNLVMGEAIKQLFHDFLPVGTPPSLPAMW